MLAIAGKIEIQPAFARHRGNEAGKRSAAAAMDHAGLAGGGHRGRDRLLPVAGNIGFDAMLDEAVAAAGEIFGLECLADALVRRLDAGCLNEPRELRLEPRRQIKPALLLERLCCKTAGRHWFGRNPYFPSPYRPAGLRLFLQHPIDARHHRLQRSGDDVSVDADAEERRAVAAPKLDIGDRGGIGTRPHRVLAIICEIEIEARLLADRIDETGDRTVAVTRNRLDRA